MSYVTTVIVFGRYIPEGAQKALTDGYHDGERPVRFGELSAYRTREAADKTTPWDFWGGTKGPESDLFGGGFNYLDSERLKAWLASLPWYGPVIACVAHEEGSMEVWKFGEGSGGEDGRQLDLTDMRD